MGVLTRDRSVRFPRAGSQATNIMGCSWHRNKTVSKQGMAGNGKIAEEGCFTTNLFQTCMCTYIYPRGLGFSDGEAVGWGGVGWGGACYRHVHVTLMLRWWEGWGGVGHVTVMFMLRWCYVDGRGGVGWGGVGWGMLPSCSCYVDATLMGGVGVGWGGACYRHVHVTLMLRWWEGWGGVGWGMLLSCSCYVDATLMGGVGWGGACYRHVHVTLMLRWCSVGKVKKTFHRCCVRAACCWLNIQCSQCTI